MSRLLAARIARRLGRALIRLSDRLDHEAMGREPDTEIWDAAPHMGPDFWGDGKV